MAYKFYLGVPGPAPSPISRGIIFLSGMKGRLSIFGFIFSHLIIIIYVWDKNFCRIWLLIEIYLCKLYRFPKSYWSYENLFSLTYWFNRWLLYEKLKILVPVIEKSEEKSLYWWLSPLYTNINEIRIYVVFLDLLLYQFQGKLFSWVDWRVCYLFFNSFPLTSL